LTSRLNGEFVWGAGELKLTSSLLIWIAPPPESVLPTPPEPTLTVNDALAIDGGPPDEYTSACSI
jgi:hypothetical protein